MKFLLFLFPSIPATPEERQALRPIAQRSHKFQQMLDEVREIAPSGRAARGSPGVAMSESDDVNRALFEEVFEILQLAWKDEPFSFQGRFWQYPFPHDEGTPWPGAPWTEKYGTPGVVVDGKLRKLNVVPKPFQKPHPQLFTAYSSSEATIRWAAPRGVVPTVTMTGVRDFKQKAEAYRLEAARAGRKLELGQNMSCGQYMSVGNDREHALELAAASNTATYYRDFGGPFGFWEAFRFPEDEAKYPSGKVMLPPSEWTLERLERKGHLVAGSPADIRRHLDELVAQANPEFLQFSVSQGFLPLEETIRQLRIYGEQIMPYYM
jgi:alkanesulfonate monooxygenase SsuD/methylene tetrahydromethanopterin reductase-like flavin-dependent oxidoreductase (luciferase family)